LELCGDVCFDPQPRNLVAGEVGEGGGGGGRQIGWVVKLSTHHSLITLRMTRAIPPLPPDALMACLGIA